VGVREQAWRKMSSPTDVASLFPSIFCLGLSPGASLLIMQVPLSVLTIVLSPCRPPLQISQKLAKVNSNSFSMTISTENNKIKKSSTETPEEKEKRKREKKDKAERKKAKREKREKENDKSKNAEVTEVDEEDSDNFDVDHSPESMLEEGKLGGMGMHKRPTQTNRALSSTSQMYDIDGDGKLDEAEQAMRDMDIENRGRLSNKKVYKVMVDQMKLQQEVFSLKRMSLVLVMVVALLSVATLGTSFAAATLAKDTSISNGDLVGKADGTLVATQSRGSPIYATVDALYLERRRRRMLGVETVDDRRFLQTKVTDGVKYSCVSEPVFTSAIDAWRKDATPITVSSTIDGTMLTEKLSADCGLATSSDNRGGIWYRGLHSLCDKASYNVYCPVQSPENTASQTRGVEGVEVETDIFNAEAKVAQKKNAVINAEAAVQSTDKAASKAREDKDEAEVKAKQAKTSAAGASAAGAAGASAAGAAGAAAEAAAAEAEKDRIASVKKFKQTKDDHSAAEKKLEGAENDLNAAVKKLTDKKKKKAANSATKKKSTRRLDEHQCSDLEYHCEVFKYINCRKMTNREDCEEESTSCEWTVYRSGDPWICGLIPQCPKMANREDCEEESTSCVWISRPYPDPWTCELIPQCPKITNREDCEEESTSCVWHEGRGTCHNV
jgi:hypothetical protein